MHNPQLINNDSLRNVSKVNANLKWCESSSSRNDKLLREISDYFISRFDAEGINSDSPVWDPNVRLHGDIINYLREGNLDKMFDYLSIMFAKNITHGTAGGVDYYNSLVRDTQNHDTHLRILFDKTICLAQQLGYLSPFNPENYFYTRKHDSYAKLDLNQIFKSIHDEFGDVSAPKFAGGALGLDTRFGVYCERDLMSLSIALTVARRYKSDNNKQIRICEIGGGVGHLAYYLYKVGFRNISIVDLPTVSVSQMYFLGDNLGENTIKFLSPSQFDGDYDLVLNADSLPEMGMETAKKYLDTMKGKTKHFISVNHEDNERGFSVNSLCTMEKFTRFQFWLRRGYLWEEYM